MFGKKDGKFFYWLFEKIIIKQKKEIIKMNEKELKKTKEELAETDRRILGLLAERAKLAFKIKESETEVYEKGCCESKDTKQTRNMIEALARKYKENDKGLRCINFEMLAYSTFLSIISICNYGLYDDTAFKERDLKKP
ncbi:hypothetical protein L6267_03820 [Candidatus Parcubacteria bacterium]|nr:hypothetical protein [Candidatus Parcubacteria bacterium]